mmetsp:Transcript_102854/g.331849  ORF Transcript_102854/g.331849 Transcript_102854/m.331849 type:complete len:174 (-) Transcript_102854:149-670(-)
MADGLDGGGPAPKGAQLYRGPVGGASTGASAARPGYGRSGHRLMCPPPGYKFIPNREHVCREYGCFECYDIYCERCESKDRRIIELEMRNNELVKHITLLQARVFPRGGESRVAGTGASAAGAASGPLGSSSGGDPFAYVQSPVLYDPGMGIQYQATTTFSPVAGGARIPPPS